MALLGLLDREPSHGYDLKRDYDTYFGRGRPLPYGQVYATLRAWRETGRRPSATPSQEPVPIASGTTSPRPVGTRSRRGSRSPSLPSPTCRPICS